MLKNMTVGACLLTRFLLVTLVGAIMVCASIVDTSRMSDEAELARKVDLTGVTLIKDANIALAYTGRELRSMLLAPDDGARAGLLAAVAQHRREIHAALDQARPLFAGEEGQALLAAVDAALADYESAIDETLKKAAGGTGAARDEAIRHVFAAMAPRGEAVVAELDKLSGLKVASAEQHANHAWGQYRSDRAVMLGLAAVALLAGIALGLLIMYSGTRDARGEPVDEGNLAVDIELYLPKTQVSWL